MLLPAAAFVFLTALLCSDAQSQPSVVSANCSDVEKDAGVALDLINKHRREGYVFSLLRVANAHVQNAKDASILYLTLDVMETKCPVLSRTHWTSCDSRRFISITDFGQCKAVVYINRSSEREKLYGYNCTVSPVPSQLYKCVDCPVKITTLEDVDQHAGEAERILEEHRQKSNETRYFKVEKVQKVFKAEASRTGYLIEFIIKEAKCPRNGLLTNASECEFLSDKHARQGFCSGRVVYGTEEGDVAEAESCEIYDIPNDRHPFNHHCHHDVGEHHHHHNGSPHRHPHHHRHHHHHHRRPHHHHHHHHHSFSHHHGGHRRGYGCPSCPDHYNHGLKGPMGHNRSSENSQEEYPDFPPPPGPHHPPPPPGGPHHLPPSNYPPPPLGPPPPRDTPHDLPPPPSRKGNKHGHWERHHHDRRCNRTTDERGRDSSPEEESDSFRDLSSFHESDIGSVHHIPVLSQDDVLQAPSANFLDHPCSPRRCHEKHPFPHKDLHEKPVVQPFPEILSESKSCPGKAKDNPLGVLALYPPQLSE